MPKGITTTRRGRITNTAKANAVAAVMNGESISKVAKRLNTNTTSVRKWVSGTTVLDADFGGAAGAHVGTVKFLQAQVNFLNNYITTNVQ